MKVSLKDIEQARETVRALIQKTRLEKSLSASDEIGSEVYLKFENEQRTGSFKIRGALNKFQSLTPDERARGVVASSAGNHAQGVALAAKEAGIRATVVMPARSSMVKQAATRGYGAQVVLHGEIYDEAFQHAKVLEKEKGLIFIPPYEDAKIIAGQGTLGLEVHEDLPDLDSIFIPIGGGGLIAGVATALKALNPRIKIYGVVAQNVPAMRALYKGESVKGNPTYASIADGISVKNPSPIMFESFIKPLVDDIIAVDETEIAAAMVYLLERAKTVTEGSGAVTFAAMRKVAHDSRFQLGKKTCAVLSGGNIDLNLMTQILESGLTRSGRMARIAVVVDDRPGALFQLTKVLAEQGANVLQVEHDRLSLDLQPREAKISFLVETRNESHVEEIKTALKQSGVALKIFS